MASLILILKGFFIGIGKIIPGVSGSLIAVSLGVYEKAINCVTFFFKDWKNNTIFLGKLALGVLIAILLFSNVILYLLDKHYLITIALFVGLIAGTIPAILKKHKLRKDNIIYAIGAIVLVVFLYLFKSNNIFSPSNNVLDYLFIVIIGFLDMATMIIPGISGTATFMMLGCYEFVLNLFSNPFLNIKYTCLFLVGLLIGAYITSKFISWALNKSPSKIYAAIIGFSISSIIYLILKIVPFITIINIWSIIVVFIVGYLISFSLEKF